MNTKEKLQPFFDVLDTEDVVVFAKRLSANDTGASGAHQAGPYLPNGIAFSLCPRLQNDGGNPCSEFESSVLSHEVTRNNKLTWYNQGSRNECRITRWAEDGRKDSVLQKEMTGGLTVILFKLHQGEIAYAWVWFCTNPDEEDLIEERLGPIEPGSFLFDGHSASVFSGTKKTKPCAQLLELIPVNWLSKFPDGKELISLTYSLLAGSSHTADHRLLTRRSCEYELFLSIEQAHVLPQIKAGFETVDAFIEMANSVTNRRKSRSGKSFELHLEQIFLEDLLVNTRGGRTEGKKSPDFLFPSVAHYHDLSWKPENLRMLGVKTTCKDRWRQILNEADRIPKKHLITLQEGVSIEQFREMENAGVTLVVPTALQKKYPEKIRSSLVTLSQFILETKSAVGS
ncbi:MAG: type II restriction endonuclease [Azonexus sp.]|nr:type II restriction endonuclease [Azonexus sp.]